MGRQWLPRQQGLGAEFRPSSEAILQCLRNVHGASKSIVVDVHKPSRPQDPTTVFTCSQAAKSDLIYFEQLRVEDWPSIPFCMCPLCGDCEGVYVRPRLLIDPDYTTSTATVTPFDDIHPHPKRINHTHFGQINYKSNIFSPGDYNVANYVITMSRACIVSFEYAT